MKTYIIAEAGVNHNGNLELAYRLIDKAVEAGVDCIKFQTFKSDKVVSKFAEKAEYQKKANDFNENQLDMVKKLELKFEDFINLKNYADKLKIDFCSTAFDEESVNFLHTLQMPFWKIPSGEITNLPYLLHIASFNEPIIMSTGMSNIEEISAALSYIRKECHKEITLLHCNTEYPTPIGDVNLNVMSTLGELYKCRVGYSDHTLGIEVPVIAVAMGAVVIEKHFTLDKTMEGPDHKASLDPVELKEMVVSIRRVELIKGSSEKTVTNSESGNRQIARKSIVAKRNILAGEIFTDDNITCKRPGTGISPMSWFDVLGSCAKKDFLEDELIEL